MTMPHRVAVPNSDEAPVVRRASMLALVTDAYGGYGGIAQYNRDFLGAALKSGKLDSILALPRIAPHTTGLLPAGLQQEKAVKGRLRYAMRALVRAWRTRPAIIYNAHVLHAPLAMILARLVGARLVSQLHGTEAWEPLPRRCRRALEASDLILTVSRDTRARVLAQLRIAPERVVVLNNTVGAAFRPGDHASARRRLGLGDEFAILTVARLDERDDYKGHDRIIKLLPDLRAGCSLADACPPELFKKFKDQHPDHVVISYINCSAAIKALSDIICTSSNAVKIVESVPRDKKIIFAPDKNLGAYVAKKTGRDMVLWNGTCMVHEIFSLQKITKLKHLHPDALLIAHPECEEPVLKEAAFIGSTTALLNFTNTSSATSFIVATESGIMHQMQKLSPEKTFIPAPPDNNCACNDCPHMKLNTLEKVYLCMKYDAPEVIIPEHLMAPALKPLKRMLEISAQKT